MVAPGVLKKPSTLHGELHRGKHYPPICHALSESGSGVSKIQVWYTFTEHKVSGYTQLLVPVRLSASTDLEYTPVG